MEHWIWMGLEHSSSVDWVVFPHNSGLSSFIAFCCHHRLGHDTAPCCKVRLLTDTLANHTEVMPVSMVTIVSTLVSPRRDSNHIHTIGTSQTSQTLIVGPVCSYGTDKWGNFTRPIYKCESTSSSLMQTLISCSDEDLGLTVHIHPDCPCPPIAELQSCTAWTD